MSIQHTPGPWTIWNFSDDPRHVAVGPDAGGLAVTDVVACNAHGCYTAESELRGQANARLIAAAPDLLDALRDARKMVWNMTGDDPVCAPFNALLPRIDAAIARATGA